MKKYFLIVIIFVSVLLVPHAQASVVYVNRTPATSEVYDLGYGHQPVYWTWYVTPVVTATYAKLSVLNVGPTTQTYSSCFAYSGGMYSIPVAVDLLDDQYSSVSINFYTTLAHCNSNIPIPFSSSVLESSSPDSLSGVLFTVGDGTTFSCPILSEASSRSACTYWQILTGFNVQLIVNIIFVGLLVGLLTRGIMRLRS